MMDFTYASLNPVPVTRPDVRNMRQNRTFQGIPGIARIPSGRLFAVWYAGGITECCENFVMMAVSDDNGVHWSDAVAVVDPAIHAVRAFDSTLWLSPDGRLHWFWAQSCGGESGVWDGYDGIGGVFVSILENPEDNPNQFRFSPSRRISNGIMMNKPTVLADGTWALPVSNWTGKQYMRHDSLGVRQGCRMVISTDGGKTFQERGLIDMTNVEQGACFDEHSFVQHLDGAVTCYIRVNGGVAVSRSEDSGFTWSAPELSKTIGGPNSRMYAVRLKSGRILMINHDMSEGKDTALWRSRERLTAWLSEDDGKSWPYSLLLDERKGVSYPDAQEGEPGSLFIIYDHDRMTGGDILLARITEDDILAGKQVSPDSGLKILVDHTRAVPTEL